jgi:hypothetical protein
MFGISITQFSSQSGPVYTFQGLQPVSICTFILRNLYNYRFSMFKIQHYPISLRLQNHAVT